MLLFTHHTTECYNPDHNTNPKHTEKYHVYFVCVGTRTRGQIQ